MTIFIISVFVMNIVSLLLGYYLGSQSDPSRDYLLTRKKVGDLYRKATRETLPTGQIKPKTAKELLLKKLPAKEREGIEAMRETLKDTPEIETHRKLVEQYRRGEPKIHI